MDDFHSSSAPVLFPFVLPPSQHSPQIKSINAKFSFNVELQKITYGKQLLLEDLPFEHAEIQRHFENGYLLFRRGIENKGRLKACVRCGNQDLEWFGQFHCSRCGQNCTYCRKCLKMGRIGSCTPLITWSGPMPDFWINDLPALKAKYQAVTTPLLVWEGKLSQGQQRASNRVIEAIEQKGELLVWAVCGAGKTELLFSGIEHALKSSQRVCIATPRTDVVLELTPRLRAVFPSISIASLYGGSPDRHLSSPLTISTTHQLLRFYHAFDLVIIDEVDAFPYSVDETLTYAVKQARTPDSTVIYLTATPNQKVQKECRSGKQHYVTIPARFHGHPLPVPEFVWCGNWSKTLNGKKMVPVNVMKWLEKRLIAGKQALLFLPKIELIDEILPILKMKNPSIEGVHAGDPDRKEKVLKMRNKEIPLLLTTTILERGVTFPNIDVAILGAEDRIFSESALVQIAGRVGRSQEHPTGTITFFHYGKTIAMENARRAIITMNKEAKRTGLINE